MVELEVETKVPLKSGEVANLRKRILKIAKFKKKNNKSDDYFAIPVRMKGDIKRYPKKAFRIRDDKKELVVNFKKWLKSYWTKEIVVKEEFEFSIAPEKKDRFLALMDDLGFRQWLKKFKISESYIYKKNPKVNIEINKVRHLGYFMEIEYIAFRSELKRAIRTVRSIVEELGLKGRADNIGYTRRLWDKGIKDKKYWVEV